MVGEIEQTESHENERLLNLRRLVAMGVGRARKTVVIGYRSDDAPAVAEFFDANTCDQFIV